MDKTVAQAPTANPVPPVDFDTAYAAALEEEIAASANSSDTDNNPKVEDEPAEPAEPVAAEPASPEAEPAPAEPVAAEATPTEPVSAEPAPAEPVAAEPAKDTGNEALLAQIAQLQAQITELSKSKEPAPAPAAQPEPAKPIEPPTADSLFTAEEKKLLESYEEDWPEVSKAESLRVRLAVEQAKDEIYRNVAKVIGTIQNSFQPVVSAYASTAEEQHFAAIKEAHKDYSDALVTEVEAWASKQPAYLKEAALAVLDHGTSEEVIDLFNRFKKDVGKAEPNVPQPTEPPKPKVDPAVVSSLAPVQSGRKPEVVADPLDKNDFESAWRVAAGT